MKLSKLLKCLPQYEIYNNADPVISSIEMDSRKVEQGSLFICIKGYTVDGHDFVKDAIQNGAVAILSEKKLDAHVPVIVVKDTKRSMAVIADYFYGHPTKKLHVIGVTGTNGKTTVTHMLEQIFRAAAKKTGVIGTIHIKIGEKIYEAANTTPESLVLQQTFHQMANEQVDAVFMEVSSHALHLGRVRGCDFNIAVFTNLTQDHLDYHKTMDEYQKAKGLLFSQLGNTYDDEHPKFAILNADDPASAEFSIQTAAHVLTYGIYNEADITATNIKLTASGTSLTLVTPYGQLDVETKLIGEFNIYNLLAAVGAALVSNIKLDTIEKSIQLMEPVAGRFEVVSGNHDFTVIVDYAHTPDSLKNVLATINQFAAGKVYVIVGCGGDRDKGKRPLMAAIAQKYSDVPIFTSDNPRSEDPEQIIKDMEQGVSGDNYHVIIDRSEAIQFAIRQAQKDDVILIAGKGHETYQILKDKTISFDDRIVAREAIKERLS